MRASEFLERLTDDGRSDRVVSATPSRVHSPVFNSFHLGPPPASFHLGLPPAPMMLDFAVPQPAESEEERRKKRSGRHVRALSAEILPVSRQAHRDVTSRCGSRRIPWGPQVQEGKL